MNIVKTYGNYIKKYAGTHPAVSRKMIDIGLHLEQFRTEHFVEKNNAESISEAEYARRKKYASCAGIPGIHGLVQSVCTRGNFPVLRTQCAFHGMSFLVSLRIYV